MAGGLREGFPTNCLKTFLDSGGGGVFFGHSKIEPVGKELISPDLKHNQ